MQLIKGIGLLLVVLCLFSLFSFKAPKGSKAMSGLANAAVATFLVEAICLFVFGDLMGIEFMKHVGEAAGSMGGPAAAILASIAIGGNPVLAVVAGVSVKGLGILPGFLAGYLVTFIGKKIEDKLPEGVDLIVASLVVAPIAFGIGHFFEPIVNQILGNVGATIEAASTQSPYVMGFILGGLMKMICTSPLSAMAITAILGLSGLPMGIASIACVGGAITDAVVFKRLGLGNNSACVAVAIEPLTQAHIVSRHPLKIFPNNFVGGAIAGMIAVYFNIISNAPGTASPVPGALAPFGFNPPLKVISAIILAMVAGAIVGYIGTEIIRRLSKQPVQLKQAKAA